MISRNILILVMGLSLPVSQATAAPAKITNKLLQMYRFYYLPFGIDFEQGGNINEILPKIKDRTNKRRLLDSAELQSINEFWDAEKKEDA